MDNTKNAVAKYRVFVNEKKGKSLDKDVIKKNWICGMSQTFKEVG